MPGCWVRLRDAGRTFRVRLYRRVKLPHRETLVAARLDVVGHRRRRHRARRARAAQSCRRPRGARAQHALAARWPFGARFDVPRKDVDALFDVWDPDGTGRFDYRELYSLLRRRADL